MEHDERTREGEAVLNAYDAYNSAVEDTLERFFSGTPGLENFVQDVIDFENGHAEVNALHILEALGTRDRMETFLRLEPDVSQAEIAEELQTNHAYINNYIQEFADAGLAVKKGRTRGQKYFYGPLAHPVLQLYSELEGVFTAYENPEPVTIHDEIPGVGREYQLLFRQYAEEYDDVDEILKNVNRDMPHGTQISRGLQRADDIWVPQTHPTMVVENENYDGDYLLIERNGKNHSPSSLPVADLVDTVEREALEKLV